MKIDGTVLITGASSGIGRTTAELLAKAGYTVFGTSRSPVKVRGGAGFKLLPLDVRSDESVKSCVETVLAHSGKIDALINNAGYVLVGAAEETSIDEAKAQFETNFFGVARMVSAVLPAMRAAGRGKIVNMSSLAGLTSIPFSGFYCASKFALEAYCEALGYELRPFGIFVSLVEPGFVTTPLGETARIATTRLPAYEAVRSRVIKTIAESVTAGMAPERVAECVLEVIRSRSPRLRYRVGADAKWLPRLKTMVPWPFFEAGVRKKFNLDGSQVETGTLK